MAVTHASPYPNAVDESLTAHVPAPENSAADLVPNEPRSIPQVITAAWYWTYTAVLKRAIDVVVASLALLFLSLVLAMIAVAVRLDSPGPALYRQRRVGRGGQPFTIYKFRTMAHEPGPAVRYFASEGKIRHKIANDPRVTRLGAVLRRASIDELPQLINILKGDMSLIGPRPELIEIVETYQPWQHRRHNVRPGLTGWWQVCGRNDRPMEENTELDLYYIDHVSPGLDLKILMRTVKVVFTGKGAI